MRLGITTYCSIGHLSVKVNRKVVFRAADGSEDLLKLIYNQLNPAYPKFFKMDDLCRLGFLGVEWIVKERPELSESEDDAIALVFQNEMSSLQSDSEHQLQLNKGVASPATFVYTLPNIVVGEIAIRNKWFGESAFFVGPKSDVAMLVDYTKSLILNRKAKIGIVGFIESFAGDHFLRLLVVEETNSGDEFNVVSLSKFIAE